jgi:hypothetical protein
VTRRPRSSRLVWLGLGLGLGVLTLATACGPTSTTTSAANAPPSSASTTTAPPLSDAQRAAVLQLGMLRQTDLGDGWAEAQFGSTKSLTVDTLGALAAEPACAKLAQTIVKVQATDKSQSPVFEADTRIAENSITTFMSTADPDKLLSVLNRTGADDCLDKAFETAFRAQQDELGIPAGSTISSVRTRKRSVKPVGDDRAGFEITIDLADAKGNIIGSRVITRVAVEVGPTILDFSFIGDSSAANIEDSMKPVVDRVAACQSPAEKCDVT